MPGPLVATKLHIPASRRSLVSRARLADRLAAVTDVRVTLVSAPAGFGKTTLVAECLREVTDPDLDVAWLSLDEHDDDPQRFWAYVLAALDAAQPGSGVGAQGNLEAGAPTETVLTTLVNDLHGVDRAVVLVLDDLHAIRSPEIHEGLTFLVDHLPATTHLVVTTRADPPWPLARWRARGELTEIRSVDLRFTVDETSAYLTGAMGLPPSASEVDALEARTEGWIAALQLAALSMQGRDDVADFVAGFTGDDRFVVDYLAGEVLHRQPAPVRRFLLETSVLERLTGSLCDAVTGTGGGSRMLADLDRENLFVLPLDDRRE